MNFQQLRIIREAVRCNYNLTNVANALFTSQSGVSKHIKDLEDELGVELFVRKGKRLFGLTEPGQELLVIVERMLQDANNIKNLADQYTRKDEGQLTVATTHTQSRYALPLVVTQFKKAFPKVHLKLLQGSPDEIVQLLLDGRADIGVATEGVMDAPEIMTFPYYSWHHAVLVPHHHPLIDVQPLTLEAVAQYPIVTYHEGFTGRGLIDKTFKKANLQPDIVMSALDSDVIKTYAELGLGIGILASMAYNADKDTSFTLLDSKHLFAENTTHIAVRQGHYLRGYAYQFIELCNQNLTESIVRSSTHI